MAKLTWDDTGKRFFETGVSNGVLYPMSAGAYQTGVAWNGLVSVTDSPSGAESNPQYADNIKYLELRSPEEKGITIEAFTYPDKFAACDGSAEPTEGVQIAQQPRAKFGFSWQSKKGNDVDNEEHGFFIHIAYGCTAAPTEKAYSTINDSPEAATFSWECDTTKVPVSGMKPTSYIKIDSTKAPAAGLTSLMDKLYGAATGDGPKLPTPDEVLALFGP